MSTVFNKKYLSEDAFINPKDAIKIPAGFPELCVSTFSINIINSFFSKKNSEIIGWLYSSNGKLPIYKIIYKGKEIAIYLSRVGAPACVAAFEEVFAMGARKFVFFGSCGILDKSADRKIIIPVSAIRDEGTSYFYKSPSEDINMNSDAVVVLKRVLNSIKHDYIEGRVWTTDGVYRETVELIQERRSQGCIAVDMECAAMIAAAEYRGASFMEFLFGADNLDCQEWEIRDLAAQGLNLADQYMELALECVINL